MHPLVVSGEITPDEAILKFLVNFTDDNNDGTISKADWDKYYTSVSDKIENEGHFVDLMNLVWKWFSIVNKIVFWPWYILTT